jgi:flagellin
MTSILTNTGAMTALQTLRSINSNLAQTQNEISTGKSISSAKDNSAIWAISKVMESDVAGFQAIKSSLSLGESSVAVARDATESITKLLTDIKSKIVAAQEENVDRAKLQTDIGRLREQIATIVNGSQFNGLNLINGSETADVRVLASLDRNSNGTVSASYIDVARQNLSTTTPATAQAFGTTDAADQATANAIFRAGTADTVGDDTAFDPTSPAATIANGGTLTFNVGQVSAGTSYEILLDNINVNVQGGGAATAQRTFQYVAGVGDSTADVARNLVSQINAFFGAATNSAEGYSISQGTGANSNQFTITNATNTAGGTGGTINLQARVQTGGTPGSTPASGGLGALQNIDVRSDAGATAALGAIDGLIQRSIDAAAAFGSAQSRIEIQSNFVSKLSDSLKSGIGSLVDADLEEASARLQALQVQQQLGIQSLSIANQAPQTILALFR